MSKTGQRLIDWLESSFGDLASSSSLIYSEMPLKVLAHNDYIGRIIGKQGDIINSIKRDTDTTVTVSSVNDMSMNVERVITIKGELENMIKALAIIHAKIRSAFENDSKTYGHQAMVMSTIPQMPMLTQAPVPYHHHHPHSHMSAPPAPYNGGGSGAGGGGGALPTAAHSSNNHHYHHHHGGKAQAPNGATYGTGSAAGAGQLIAPGLNNPSAPGGGGAGGPAASQQSPMNPATSNTSFAGYYPSPLIHHLTALSAGAHSHSHPNHGYSPNLQAPNAGPIYGGHVPGPSTPGGHMVPGGGGAYGNVPPHPASHGGGYLAPHHMSSGHHHHHHQSPMGNEYGGPSVPGGSPVNGYPEPEKVFLYIPNTAVGAIIGSKGSYIKNLIKLSGASIKIAPVPADEENKNVSERQVIIAGLPDSQCKAQFYIYEKIRQERFTTDDNVKLRAEIAVPASKIGRIIGRAGKNVREIQRSTGATIKLPDETVQSHQSKSKSEQHSSDVDASSETKAVTTAATEEPSTALEDHQEPESATTPSTEVVTSEKTAEANGNNGDVSTAPVGSGNEFVMVGIIGTFNSSQLAQRRIQALVNSTHMRFEAPGHPMGPPAIVGHHLGVEGGKGGHFYPKSNGFNGGRKGRGGGHHGNSRNYGAPFNNNNKANREAGSAKTAESEETAPAPVSEETTATTSIKLDSEQPAPAVTA